MRNLLIMCIAFLSHFAWASHDPCMAFSTSSHWEFGNTEMNTPGKVFFIPIYRTDAITEISNMTVSIDSGDYDVFDFTGGAFPGAFSSDVAQDLICTQNLSFEDTLPSMQGAYFVGNQHCEKSLELTGTGISLEN